MYAYSLSGFVVGALIGMTGVGAIGMIALLRLYLERPLLQLIGSDIAHAVPLILVAGIGHWLIGSIDMAILGSLLLGSIPGIALGSFAAGRVPERVLRLTLAAVLFAVGGRLMLWTAV